MTARFASARSRSSTRKCLGAFLLALLTLSLDVFGQTNAAWIATKTKATDVSKATYVSDMQAGETIRVIVGLQLRNRAQLEALAQSVASKGAAPLTQQQFMAGYAPTPAQVQAVSSYLRQNGFINLSVSADNLSITADGTAATVSAAFQTKMQHFNINGRAAIANVTDALVPQSLSNVVLGVLGLQTVHIPVSRPQTAGISTGTAGAANPLALRYNAYFGSHAPLDYAQIYGAYAMPSATATNIGIITASLSSQSGIGSLTQAIADLNTFAASSGYPAPKVTVTYFTPLYPTSQIPAPNYTIEWNLDTQIALAAAGGSVGGFYIYSAGAFDSSDLYKAVDQAVIDGKANVVSMSMGSCESGWSNAGAIASFDQVFLAGIAKGQTFSISSGDNGAYTECTSATSPEVAYPASSPYVIAVGGTSLTAWRPVALKGVQEYDSETAWNCASYMACYGDSLLNPPVYPYGGSGGGISAVEKAPAWQTSSGVLSGSTYRGVPDIAFEADPAAGVVLVVGGSTAATYNMLDNVNDEYYTYNNQTGGTSLAAPLFAGMWARVQTAHSNALTFSQLANVIYAASSHTGHVIDVSPFNQVCSGTNGAYSINASTCAWNYVTGYGSIYMASFSSLFP